MTEIDELTEISCPNCDGKGKLDSIRGNKIECKTCYGYGSIWVKKYGRR